MILHIFSCVWHLLIKHLFSLVTVFSLSSAERVIFHVLNTSLVVMAVSDAASVLIPLCYHNYISATWASTFNTYSQCREVEAASSGLYVTVTWMSAAHVTCPEHVSAVQTLASVDKDKPQPSLTWQSSGLCKSLIWHSCLTLNGVFLLTWQPFSQCYDHKLFMQCGTIKEMHM